MLAECVSLEIDPSAPVEWPGVAGRSRRALVAVDTRARVINMNQAALDLTGAELPRALGKPIQQVIDDAGLRQILEEALTSGRSAWRLVGLAQGGRRAMRARARALVDGGGAESGALVVIW